MRITECKLVLVRAAEPSCPVSSPGSSTFVLQLGDSNVGKSSLVMRFVKNQFSIEQTTTVGAAFLQQAVPLDDSEDKIQFGIWDTAGSERYRALAPMVRPPPVPHCTDSNPVTATDTSHVLRPVLSRRGGGHRGVRHHLIRAPPHARARHRDAQHAPRVEQHWRAHHSQRSPRRTRLRVPKSGWVN